MTTPPPRGTHAPQLEVVRLARQAATVPQPAQALRAIAALRGCLDALEAKHVDAALHEGCSWRMVAEALGVSLQAAHRKHTARMVATQPEHAESVAGNRLVHRPGGARRRRHGGQEDAAAQSSSVGTEHLLAGLVRQRDGVAAEALATLGVTLDKVRHCAQASADRAHGNPETADHKLPGGSAQVKLPLSRRGREALEQALREALRLGDDHLGVEHLLLALLRDGESRCVKCLERLRVSPAMVEDELRPWRRATKSRLPEPRGPSDQRRPASALAQG